MRKIFKYPIAYHGTFHPVSLLINEGAKIVHAAMQGDLITLWAVVDPKAPAINRIFHVLPTGGELDEKSMEHVATVVDGAFVWHVCEILT